MQFSFEKNRTFSRITPQIHLIRLGGSISAEEAPLIASAEVTELRGRSAVTKCKIAFFLVGVIVFAELRSVMYPGAG